jgi:hypothetical protein
MLPPYRRLRRISLCDEISRLGGIPYSLDRFSRNVQQVRRKSRSKRSRIHMGSLRNPIHQTVLRSSNPPRRQPPVILLRHLYRSTCRVLRILRLLDYVNDIIGLAVAKIRQKIDGDIILE